MNHSYLLIGSNMGDRLTMLNRSLSLIRDRIGEISKRSSVYETEPWGFTHKNNFLNQCILVKTSLNPHELLQAIKEIERILGRKIYSGRYEERVIDIDILFYNDLILCSNNLEIPHKQLTRRKFVLVPLMEMDPELRHPLLGKSVRDLYRLCEDNLMVRKYIM